MTEQASKSLVAILCGQAVHPMPSSRMWGVIATKTDDGLGVIEDHAGWLYRNRQAYEGYQPDGDAAALLEAREWAEWDDGEEWAQGLSVVLGSEEYRHSGGGIWLVFYRRLDGRFAVIGADSVGIYVIYEEFDADLAGELGESHHFI